MRQQQQQQQQQQQLCTRARLLPTPPHPPPPHRAECNRGNALFFVAFIVGGMYLLLSIVLAVATAAFVDSTREEVVLKYSRAFGGADVAFAELTGSDVSGIAAAAVARAHAVRRSAADVAKADEARTTADASAGSSFRLKTGLSFRGTAAPEGGVGVPLLQRADLLAFFAVLRPDVPPSVVERIARVVEPVSDALTSSQFRSLLLNFGRLRVLAKAPGSGSGAAPQDVGVAESNGRLSRLLRCCGRSDEESAAPESALEAIAEDCEWLDGDAPEAHGASGAAAVVNPLAALAGGGATATRLVAAAAATAAAARCASRRGARRRAAAARPLGASSRAPARACTRASPRCPHWTPPCRRARTRGAARAPRRSSRPCARSSSTARSS